MVKFCRKIISRKTRRNLLLPYGIISVVVAVILFGEAGNSTVPVWFRIVGGLWATIGIALIFPEGGADD